MISSNPFGAFANSSEDHWVLGNDYFTKDNLFDGAVGEKVVKAATQINYKRRDGIHVKANTFNDQYSYCCGKDMDIIIQSISDRYKAVAAIEVKNLAQQKKPYGTDFVTRHVLPRAKALPVQAKKILVITFENLLTRRAKQLLAQEGWTILEVGERLTTDFFRDLSRLYKLAAKIKSAIGSAIKPRAQKPANPRRHLCNTIINNTLHNNTLLPYITINMNMNTIITKQHDTPSIINTVSDDYIIQLIEGKTSMDRIWRKLERLGTKQDKSNLGFTCSRIN